VILEAITTLIKVGAKTTTHYLLQTKSCLVMLLCLQLM